jgi:predicted lactoylglutathione lyase
MATRFKRITETRHQAKHKKSMSSLGFSANTHVQLEELDAEAAAAGGRLDSEESRMAVFLRKSITI